MAAARRSSLSSWLGVYPSYCLYMAYIYTYCFKSCSLLAALLSSASASHRCVAACTLHLYSAERCARGRGPSSSRYVLDLLSLAEGTVLASLTYLPPRRHPRRSPSACLLLARSKNLAMTRPAVEPNRSQTIERRWSRNWPRSVYSMRRDGHDWPMKNTRRLLCIQYDSYERGKTLSGINYLSLGVLAQNQFKRLEKID